MNECRVWSMKVWNVECKVQSVECRVWSAKREVNVWNVNVNVECKVNECGMQSVECAVWSVNVECGV